MMMLQTIAAFLVALGILIVVHEYGHYLVARLCGVKVLRFSVGFGRPLLLVRRGPDRTEWVLSIVPFGGYVKMLDEREGPVDAEEAGRAFNRKSVWRRFAIVVAGPVFNFLFAIAVYSGLYMYGLPEARPVVAEPAAGSIAKGAGFHAGDTVRRIGDHPIATWQEFRWRMLQGALQKQVLAVEVLDAKQRISVLKVDLSGLNGDDVESDMLERLGFRLNRPRISAVLGKVVAGSAAESAGLLPGDRIEAADGQAIDSWDALVQVIRARPGKPTSLAVDRAGRKLLIPVTPEGASAGNERIGRIGVGPDVPAGQSDEVFVRISYGPLESLGRSIEKTWDISAFSLKMLGKMLIGEVSWKHLSGPVTIADFAGQSAQLGWLSYVTFLALISISLGVLNLLPIPLLDGGHLMYYCLEILKGSPVSERAMELGQRVGLTLLLVMMAFAFYNDLNRLFSS
ncbi:MAG: RIP metalloprotease RseP [Proteobacteria bacterium]|nr:RIP metalloprotease RseP [Pseudomonadota bacterium]